MLCNCPLADEIPDIPSDDCLERFGQIQKFLIQRTKNGTVVNKIVIGTDNPNLLATWTALLSAIDDTKVQATPYVNNPENEAGEPREYGSGNTVLGGIPIPLGSNPTAFTGEFLDVKQSVITAMKNYNCEKELSVFLINEHGQIAGKTDNTTTPDTFYGFPVRGFFVGDKSFGNFDEPDKNFVRFSLLPNWSDGFHVVTPSDFDALVELSGS